MVEVKNVSLRFNLVEAVKAVSFNVDSGNIFGLVGSDGAGKSTLLRLIATMIKPSQGEIYINGLNVLTDRRKIKNIIGYMPQRFGLYRFFYGYFCRAPRRKKKEKR
jgi:ABC-2 type transport system ATP-binding protein